jgi:hypothetical protein
VTRHAILAAVLAASLHAAAPPAVLEAAAAARPAASPRPAKPARLTPAAADSIRAAIERDRRDTDEWLRTSPTSYLATILRRDFETRTSLTLGRAPGNDVRVDDPEVAERHLRVTVSGDSFRVEALDAGASFVAGRDTLREAVLPPSTIRVGRFPVRLSHQRFPALIVFDPKSPRTAEARGFQWYPIDFAYRFELPLTPDSAPDTVVVMSTRGNARRALRAGWFDFEVQGRRCRLEAQRLLEPGVGEHDLAIFFRDRTTGSETYSVGRYLDVQRLPDGRYVLDFNLAYNPACAVSDHYNCPIPSRENVLRVAIRAGEKDSHYVHGGAAAAQPERRRRSDRPAPSGGR